MTKLSTYLKESSLSKVFRHNEKHDCGALTAFRKARDCGDGIVYTKAENKKRNISLETKLQSIGYDIIKVGGKIKKEESVFVVDAIDKGTLENDLMKLGELFDQDSILFIPKGAVKQESKAYLIGTNHCHNNRINYGKKILFEKGRFGYESKIYTTYINGRPFIFEDTCMEIKLPASGMGIWAMHLIANKHWNDIEVDMP